MTNSRAEIFVVFSPPHPSGCWLGKDPGAPLLTSRAVLTAAWVNAGLTWGAAKVLPWMPSIIATSCAEVTLQLAKKRGMRCNNVEKGKTNGAAAEAEELGALCWLPPPAAFLLSW